MDAVLKLTENNQNESPAIRRERLEKTLLELSRRELIAEDVLKTIKCEKKELKEEILACMREENMPLLRIMMGE